MRLKTRFEKLFNDSHLVAAILIGFAFSAIKKWEPGGNLDTIWYSAVAKNIYLTGDYFHFYISKYFASQIFDHMPLMYWVIATLFKLFSPSDFVARLYPIICSFFSFILVFRIGKFIKDEKFGLIAVVSYALCFGASKWQGAVMHDVPLTTFMLATFYFFLQGGRKYYLCSVFFALAVFTKGPIAFGLPLGIFIWSLIAREARFLRDTHFYKALLLLGLLLAIPLLPALSFDGHSAYYQFFKWKTAYLEVAQSRWRYFAYFEVLSKGAPLQIALFIYFFFNIKKTKQALGHKSFNLVLLNFVIAASVFIPLSFFKVKFPHYLLPFYPFFAIASASPLYRSWKVSAVTIQRLALAMIMIMVFLPIKTTGKRTKEVINIVNAIKIDKNIASKTVFFMGLYDDDMNIFQNFKFYGNIDLKPIQPVEIPFVAFENSYFVIPLKILPVKSGKIQWTIDDCLFQNHLYCVIADRNQIHYRLPDNKLPHEIY